MPEREMNSLSSGDDGIVVECLGSTLLAAQMTACIGDTDDLKSRERTHNEGRGGAYTARRRPVAIVFAERFDRLLDAIARERQLKRWSRAKKEALMAGDSAQLKRLSLCNVLASE